MIGMADFLSWYWSKLADVFHQVIAWFLAPGRWLDIFVGGSPFWCVLLFFICGFLGDLFWSCGKPRLSDVCFSLAVCFSILFLGTLFAVTIPYCIYCNG